MIVEIKKAGVTVLRGDLATIVEAHCEGSYRPGCARLVDEFSKFRIDRPFELVVTSESLDLATIAEPRGRGGIVISEMVEPEPDDEAEK